MALTTLQGAIDGLRPPTRVVKPAFTGGSGGRWITSWFTGGDPPVGGIGSATPGAALTAPVTGQIPFTDPVSGESILSRFNVAQNAQAGDMMLVDLLWRMSGISPTVTTPQTVSSAAWPARDINQSTNGEGVHIALLVSTGTGAGVPNLSMTYTNSAGAGSKVGANIYPTVASSGVGGVWIMGEAAGDTGVRSVQDFTLSATWTAGALSLVAFRPIAYIPQNIIGSASRQRKRIEDALSLCAPRIWNGSVLDLWMMTPSSSSPQWNGSLNVSQG
jgi:hypothetical protein